MRLVHAVGLTKRYPGGILALDGLTLSLEPGLIGLVGANGAGKTTLIKILLGLIEPTGGEVRVLGADPVAEGTEVRQRLGYLPEHDCLPTDVSAADFITHMARMSGLPRSAARERAADMLRHVGLYEARYRPMDGYSTGMKQRVKLAQALVHDPALLLLDEPTDGLDPGGREEMLELVRRTGDQFGISMIVSSHLLGEIERVCDHLVAIEDGRLVRSAAIGEFTRRTAVLAVEVDRGADRLRERLADEGVAVIGAAAVDAGGRDAAGAGDGGLLVALDDDDEAVYDRIRDAAAELGLPLVRMQRRRRRLHELFEATAPAGSPTGSHADAGVGSGAVVDGDGEDRA